MSNTVPEREPQAQDTRPASTKRKKFLIGVGVVCVLVLLSAVGLFVNARHQREAQRAAYIDSLNELREQAIRCGAIAEDMCNLPPDSWTFRLVFVQVNSKMGKYRFIVEALRQWGIAFFLRQPPGRVAALRLMEAAVAILKAALVAKCLVESLIPWAVRNGDS